VDAADAVDTGGKVDKVDKVDEAVETTAVDEEPVPPVAEELIEVDVEAMLLELEMAEQDRSYSGVVLKELLTIPKLGFGVTGTESSSVNQ